MRRFLVLVTAVATVIGVVPLLSAPAAAGPSDRSGSPVLSNDHLAALQRDLGLTPDEARRRAAAVAPAAALQSQLRQRLAARFGGTWLADDGVTLKVGVTDARSAREVVAAGGEPVLVSHSLSRLRAVQAVLDGHAAKAPERVYGWYVDVRANSVVVTAHPSAVRTAEAFVESTGLVGSPVRVRTTAAAFRPVEDYQDVRGGDALYTPAGRCSVGFSVIGGYVTAGHCGVAGQSVNGTGQGPQGRIEGSVFPGDDFAWVRTNASWLPQGVVYGWNATNPAVIPVDGSVAAPVGAAVCRSGSTTGWRCGQILALDRTINYPGGNVVFGLTETSACAEAGDSGGSFLAGRQAQGVTSGTVGTCTTPEARTVFQPVNEILTRYGLTLVTTATPLQLHGLRCSSDNPGGRGPTFRCSVGYTGGVPPYTHTWTLNRAPWSQTGSVIYGACRYGTQYIDFWVVVRDSRGSTVQTGAAVECLW